MDALSLATKDHIFDICEQLMQVGSRSELLACFNGPLRQLLSHGSFACGFGTLGPDGLSSKLVIADGFPEDYLDSISAHGKIQPHSLRYWLQMRRPVALTFAPESSDSLPVEMLRSAQSYGFSNMLCHGQIELEGRHMSYVCFNRIEDEIRLRHHLILAHIMPHLHNALLRLSDMGRTAAPMPVPQSDLTPDLLDALKIVKRADVTLPYVPEIVTDLTDADEMGGEILTEDALTDRQRQILYLLGLGKTNWEISQIIDTSVNNVKYHVKRLGILFEASNRMTIVTQASQKGVMPCDWPH